MTETIEQASLEIIASGLIRRASTTCSVWTENYVVLGKPVPGPARFRKHPWSKAMHDEDGNWAGRKAAQMAYTQTALDRAIFTVDIKKVSVVYFLPKKNPDAVDFSRTKFDTMLNLSPHIASLFSNVRNVGHKQAGSVDFFLRGIRSRSGAKSISTGMKIYDEYDEMIMKNVKLAHERSSGFEFADKQDIRISTPTIPKFGISEVFESCREQHYFFKCPRCGRRTEFLYPECLEVVGESSRDEKSIKHSHLKCLECKGKILDEERESILHYDRADWETVTNADSDMKGFQINQLYSIVMPSWEFAQAVIQARENPIYEAELYNSKCGLPYVQPGAKIEDAHLATCYGNYKSTTRHTSSLITMGVDQGHRQFYWEIGEWLIPGDIGRQINLVAIQRILACGTVEEFIQLDQVMRDYQVLHCVIDVDPYMRDALSFAMRFHGSVNLCRFVRGIERNNILPNETEYTIHVNRTSWLDISQGRYKRGQKSGGIILPSDISQTYRDHVKAPIRITKIDDEGNLKSKYVSVGPDHFAFAHVYNELALPLALSNREHKNIGAFL